jgi:hypothetical protein
MTGAAPGGGARLRGLLSGAGLLAFLGAVALATAAVAALGYPLLVPLPVALAAAGYLLFKVPLRASVSGLLLLLLCVDDHGDNYGQWHTPLAIVGDMLHGRLDAVLGLPGLAVSGLEVMLVVFLVVWIHRAAAGHRVDLEDQVPAADVMAKAAIVYLLAVLLGAAWGVAHGLPAAPWKLRYLLHPLALAWLFAMAYRPRDLRLIARVVVASALVRSILAVVVQRIAIRETGGPLETATNHGDSVLFSVALFLLLADALERPSLRRFARTAALGPVLVVGILENDRRIAWVMIVMMLGVAYLLSPRKPWARAATRAVAVGLPVLMLYVAVGWNREGQLFAPVRTLRSVADSSVDSSSYWREVENFNLAMSIRQSPILGQGLGGEYSIFMQNADISTLYPEYRQWPHNSVHGLLLLLGVLGFSAVWALYAVGVFLAARSYWLARAAEQRVGALGCLAALVACHVLAWGDTGAHYPQHKIFVALALAMAAKLATATGAWPARAPARRRAAPDEAVAEVGP